jgi:hypothetical protein
MIRKACIVAPDHQVPCALLPPESYKALRLLSVLHVLTNLHAHLPLCPAATLPAPRAARC